MRFYYFDFFTSQKMEVKQSSDILDTHRKSQGVGESQGKDVKGKKPGSHLLICLLSAWHQVKASFHQVNHSPVWQKQLECWLGTWSGGGGMGVPASADAHGGLIGNLREEPDSSAQSEGARRLALASVVS